MIRPASTSDRMPVVRLLRAAHAAGGLPFGFSAPHALALIDVHMSSADHAALVFEHEGKVAGILMASAQAHPFSGTRYAAETVWWIDPDHRGMAAVDMLRAYEVWAAEARCAFCGMAALEIAPRAGVIYRRLGYRATETHYLKPLT